MESKIALNQIVQKIINQRMDYLIFIMPLHSGYFMQPKNCFPAKRPRFASLIFIADPQFGHSVLSYFSQSDIDEIMVFDRLSFLFSELSSWQKNVISAAITDV